MRAVAFVGMGLCLLVNMLMGPESWAEARESLRIKHLQRCGDRLDDQVIQVCFQASGLRSGEWQLMFNGEPVPADQIEPGRASADFKVTLSDQDTKADIQSGPAWLVQSEARSNPVWVSLKSSHVVAASEDALADNMDGLTTYVDLVSIIIEERHGGVNEARRLAEKYDAEVVGAIPPLNTYQLRLPVNTLQARDALVLRLGHELSVDAVVIEETKPEQTLEQDHDQAPSVAQASGRGDAGDHQLDHHQVDNKEWSANRFQDAVNFYQRRFSSSDERQRLKPVRVGVIERHVDFDAPDFADYLGECDAQETGICVYGRDADDPQAHGTTVTGILAATWDNGGNSGFLRGLASVSPGFEVIVSRDSDAGITANIAAAVNMVEDGVEVLNWSWGIHRVGAVDVNGDPVDSLLRSGIAMSGYEELLEEFFLWLRREHPNVVVVNSAGNASSFTGKDEYRLPSSFVTDQLLVVGGHQLSDQSIESVSDPAYAVKRKASNIDMRVDMTAAACVRASTSERDQKGAIHCGTSYSTPLVTGVVAAMRSINPALQPEQIRMLLRRSAMTIGDEYDFEPVEADDLTAPIIPSERNNRLDNPDIGYSARLDMYKALELTVKSRDQQTL